MIGIGMMLIAFLGCKDEKPEPKNRIELNDLIGTWISVDSFQTEDSLTGLYFTNESFEIDALTLTEQYPPDIKPYCVRKSANGMGFM